MEPNDGKTPKIIWALVAPQLGQGFCDTHVVGCFTQSSHFQKFLTYHRLYQLVLVVSMPFIYMVSGIALISWTFYNTLLMWTWELTRFGCVILTDSGTSEKQGLTRRSNAASLKKKRQEKITIFFLWRFIGYKPFLMANKKYVIQYIFMGNRIVLNYAIRSQKARQVQLMFIMLENTKWFSY